MASTRGLSSGICESIDLFGVWTFGVWSLSYGFPLTNLSPHSSISASV